MPAPQTDCGAGGSSAVDCLRRSLIPYLIVREPAATATPPAVARFAINIFATLRLPQSEDDHRRV
jgi:hypothetical protein